MMAIDESQTPAALGYRWPAEWEPHAATWLAWPKNPETWPGRLEAARDAFVAIVAGLVEAERVSIVVDDAAAEQAARERLAAGGVEVDRVAFHPIATDDAWLRDTGPITVVRDAAPADTAAGADATGTLPGRLALDFAFDAWGGKYPPWNRDAAVARQIAAAAGLPHRATDFVLEGGSIDGNGRGTLLTTESCLLHPNRGARTREAVERVLADWLGAKQVLWLGAGIAGDDTDGHIDDITRFVDPSTVVTVVENDAGDPNFAALRDNRQRLRTMTDTDGKPLSVVELPMPPRLHVAGEPLPASYANFYLADGVALVPTFACPSDDRALGVLRELWPDRRVVGIDCRDLVLGLGAIHCLTQSEPAASADPDGDRRSPGRVPERASG